MIFTKAKLFLVFPFYCCIACTVKNIVVTAARNDYARFTFARGSLCNAGRFLCEGQIEGSQPEWCISSMIYSGDTPFWSETLKIKSWIGSFAKCAKMLNIFLFSMVCLQNSLKWKCTSGKKSCLYFSGPTVYITFKWHYDTYLSLKELNVLHVIWTWLHPCHLSVCVWDSSQQSEEIVKVCSCTFSAIIIVIIIIVKIWQSLTNAQALVTWPSHFSFLIMIVGVWTSW